MATVCPVCGSSDTIIMKEWTYASYFVTRFLCKGCNAPFNVYYKDAVEAFSIPRRIS